MYQSTIKILRPELGVAHWFESALRAQSSAKSSPKKVSALALFAHIQKNSILKSVYFRLHVALQMHYNLLRRWILLVLIGIPGFFSKKLTCQKWQKIWDDVILTFCTRKRIIVDFEWSSNSSFKFNCKILISIKSSNCFCVFICLHFEALEIKCWSSLL